MDGRPGKFHSDENSYKDLLIFEQRLRHNMTHLNKLRRKWEVYFFALLSMICGSYYYSVTKDNALWLSLVTAIACVVLVSVYYRKLSLNKEYVPFAVRI